MSNFLLFAILGIGTGVVYALVALGIIVIHKSTHAINFAQGAIMGAAAVYFAVATNDGTPVWLALLIALVVSAVGGVVFFLLVMRPLRTAPLLAKVVSTLGLMILLQGLVGKLWPNTSVVAPPLFPTDSIQFFGIAFGVDRFYLLGTVILLSAGLWALYRFTTFGRATRAVAESERGAMLLGYSTDLIGAVNWAAGSAMAALAGVLIAPIATLDINTLALLVIPALAAALIGKFNSFGITTAAAMLIGVVQSLLTFYWQAPGVREAFPFLLVAIVLLFNGKSIPERGSLLTLRDPIASDKPFSLLRWGPFIVLMVIGLFVLNSTFKGAITTSLIGAVLAMSLVVISGLVGQISLAQMAFAGVGAFATSKIAIDMGVPFPIPILLAALVAIPLGIVLGLPAIRVRGVSLAVLTLAAAAAISAGVFQNTALTGGVNGSRVPAPAIGDFSLNAVEHPERFGIFALIITMIVIAGVLTLRQSASGRRMLAVRANERAAAVVGINVVRTKLTAFALSSFIAALGGSLLAYQLGAVAFDRFSPLASVMLLGLAYIGGIATVRGAVFAGFIANGGLLYLLLAQIPGVDGWWIVISGLLLIVTVVTQPSGAIVAIDQTIAAVKAKMSRSKAKNTSVSVSND